MARSPKIQHEVTATSLKRTGNKTELKVVTEVCGIRNQRGVIRDQLGGIWDHSPGITFSRGSQAMGSGSAVSRGITDQGLKFVTLLESTITHLGTKTGSAMKKTYLVLTLI